MDQKVHELPLEFKKSYEDTINGIILIRAQYVHNEEALFRSILTQLQKKEHMILECAKILETQKNKLLERQDSQGNDKFQNS